MSVARIGHLIQPMFFVQGNVDDFTLRAREVQCGLSVCVGRHCEANASLLEISSREEISNAIWHVQAVLDDLGMRVSCAVLEREWKVADGFSIHIATDSADLIYRVWLAHVDELANVV